MHPHVIGVQTTTPTIRQAIKVAKDAKEAVPDACVVLGGYHVSFLPEETMKECPEVDICVRGEGEYTMLELMQALNGKINLKDVLGITFRQRERIYSNPPRPFICKLDDLPFPARHLFPMKAYKVFNATYPATTMICSRGCPMQCEFCASSAMFEKKVRLRSPENVISEIEYVKEKFGTRIIAFLDDTFTLFRKWVKRFCDLLMKKDIQISWGCQTRVDKLTPSLLSKMAKAGCKAIFVGIESGVQQILDFVKKGFTVDKVKKVFRWAKNFGIRTIASFAFG